MVVFEYQVPKSRHYLVIGRGGQTVKRLQEEHSVHIAIPRQEEPSLAISVSGDDDAVEAVRKEMEAILNLELSTEPLRRTELSIERHLFGRLIGPRGSTLDDLQKRSKAVITVPGRDDKDSNVVVEGSPSAVERCRKAIEEALGVQVGVVGQSTETTEVEVIDLRGAAIISECLFFPDPTGSNFQRFLTYLRSPTHSIDICVFTITDDRVVSVLNHLLSKGVKVRIITDDETSTATGSDIMRLCEAGAQVKRDASPAHMHHKFAILDGIALINGSYNWTRGAAEHNWENIMIVGNRNIVAGYSQEFEKLWATFGALRV